MKNIMRLFFTVLLFINLLFCLTTDAFALGQNTQYSDSPFVEIPYNGETITVCLAYFFNTRFQPIYSMGDSFPIVDDPTDYRYGVLPWYSSDTLYIMADL